MVQVPFLPPPRVTRVVGSSNASNPTDPPSSVGTNAVYNNIADMEFCLLDRSLYWIQPVTSPSLRRTRALPPYETTLVAAFPTVSLWSLAVDDACTTYLGTSDGTVFRVTRNGAASPLIQMACTVMSTIVLDPKRRNLWIACGLGTAPANAGLYKTPLGPGNYTQVQAGDWRDTGIAVDPGRDRLWILRAAVGLRYLDLATESLSAAVCAAGGPDYVDGPCATAQNRWPAFARYVPGADLVLFTEFYTEGLRAVLLKTMEVVTVAGCGNETRLIDDAAGVGTAACFSNFVMSVAYDSLTGDLYTGSHIDGTPGNVHIVSIKRIETGKSMGPAPHLYLEGGGLQLSGGAALSLA